MSLILEALRKSEAERRRGSTPDVAVELPPPAARKRAGVPGWAWPAAALGIALVAMAWWIAMRPDTPPGSPASTSTQAVAEATPQAPTPDAPAVVPRAPVQVAETTVPEPVPATPARDAVTPAPAAPAPIPLPSRPPPAPAPLPPPSQSTTANANVPDIDDAGLPPVKLSMHMWDPAPTRRFVILDGQRMAEGDRNGDLTVIAIERSGVVVERNGQRARVPLP